MKITELKVKHLTVNIKFRSARKRKPAIVLKFCVDFK